MAPRVLIINPGHLGDVLLTLPAATALRAALPQAHLAFLAANPHAAVPRGCPDIDEVIALSFPRLHPPLAPMDPSELARGVASLRDRFDVVILCRARDTWSGEMATRAGVAVRVGYAISEMERFVTHGVPYDERPHTATQALRLVQGAAAALDVDTAARQAMAELVEPPTGVRFVASTAQEALADGVLRAAPSSGPRPIVLQPGASLPVKSWPADRWGLLAVELRRRYGVVPLVHGGPGESSLVDAIVEVGEGACVGLAGVLPVGALAALFRRCSLLVSVDSGPLHLAAMVGLPVVGLYGPIPIAQWRPWCAPNRHRLVRVSLPCSPCDRTFAPPCGVPVSPACMATITVEAVLQAASELIEASAACGQP